MCAYVLSGDEDRPRETWQSLICIFNYNSARQSPLPLFTPYCMERYLAKVPLLKLLFCWLTYGASSAALIDWFDLTSTGSLRAYDDDIQMHPADPVAYSLYWPVCWRGITLIAIFGHKDCQSQVYNSPSKRSYSCSPCFVPLRDTSTRHRKRLLPSKVKLKLYCFGERYLTNLDF